jgi:hypothetical protein
MKMNSDLKELRRLEHKSKRLRKHLGIVPATDSRWLPSAALMFKTSGLARGMVWL